MKTLLALVATAVVAWWMGRDYQWSHGECACVDEMAAVQPSDPWPPNVMSLDLDEAMCPNCVTPWKCNGPHDLTYQQAKTGAAIERTRPQGGM